MPELGSNHVDVSAESKLARMLGKTAQQDCRARLPSKTAGQDCRERLTGKTAGPGVGMLVCVGSVWCVCSGCGMCGSGVGVGCV
jgi:hypothetical protein